MRKAKAIREAVEAELAADPLIDADSITVISLDGDVALNGTAHSYPQYIEATRAAWRASGVTDVSNHLEVVLPPEHRRDDATLTTAANNALAASATVPEGVEASAKNGDVTLTGMVNYRRERAAAEAAVSGLTGVRNIKDAIGLRFDVDPADVSQLVMQALERHKEPQDSGHLLPAGRHTAKLAEPCGTFGAFVSTLRGIPTTVALQLVVREVS